MSKFTKSFSAKSCVAVSLASATRSNSILNIGFVVYHSLKIVAMETIMFVRTKKIAKDKAEGKESVFDNKKTTARRHMRAAAKREGKARAAFGGGDQGKGAGAPGGGGKGKGKSPERSWKRSWADVPTQSLRFTSNTPKAR